MLPLIWTIGGYENGNTRVEALKNINLTVNEGEFEVVVGPSGSGKSTFLHIVGGGEKAVNKNYLEAIMDILGIKDRRFKILFSKSK